MNQVFAVKGRLPGLNDVILANRSNKYGGAAMKKRAEERIAIDLRMAKLKPCTRPVRIYCTWIEPNRKRDPDNIASAKKFILDTLVREGILAGDGWKHIDREGFRDKFVHDPKAQGVVVEIEEVET